MNIISEIKEKIAYYISVAKFCKRNNITMRMFFGKSFLSGNFYIDAAGMPAGCNFKSYHHLTIYNIGDMPANFVPCVEDGLILEDITSFGDGFDPICTFGLTFKNTCDIPDNFHIKTSRDLIFELHKNHRGLKIGKNCNIEVGGDLYLGKLFKLPEEFNAKVNGKIYCDNYCYLKGSENSVNKSCTIWEKSGMMWINYYKLHEIIDTEVRLEYTIYKIQDIDKKDTIRYVVGDYKNNKHRLGFGYTTEGAIIDMLYREKYNKGIYLHEHNFVKNLTYDTKLRVQQAAVLYRLATGACNSGVEKFIKRKSIRFDRVYSVREIYNMTKGQYGGITFREYIDCICNRNHEVK
jgi:hypothetical protein